MSKTNNAATVQRHSSFVLCEGHSEERNWLCKGTCGQDCENCSSKLTKRGSREIVGAMASGTLASRLKQTGLGDKAAAVYAYLLENGGAYPSRIAETTKINRSTVYKVLLDLAVKGLVSEIQKGKKLYYQIGRPAALLKHAQYQIDLANDVYEQVKTLAPEIELLYSALPNKPRVLYLEGEKEVLTVYDDYISQKKPYEMVSFGNAKPIRALVTDAYYKKYRRAKEIKGITTRTILPDTPIDREYATEWHVDVSKKTRPSVRFIPRDQFPLEGEIAAYGDSKVAIVNLEKHTTAIIIEDKSLHRMVRTIFELAWRGASAK